MKTYIEQTIAKLDFAESERSYVEECLAQCFRLGFTVEDAIAYARLTEHVNPDLDEDIALARMATIADKY